MKHRVVWIALWLLGALFGLNACWEGPHADQNEVSSEEMEKQQKLSERYLAKMMHSDPNRQLDDSLKDQRELKPLPAGVPQFTVVIEKPAWRVVLFPEFQAKRSMAANAYGILHKETRQAVLIDVPVLSLPAIETWLYNEDLTLVAALVTHGHFDHASGLDTLHKEHPKVIRYLGKEDLPLLNELSSQAYGLGLAAENVGGVEKLIEGEPRLDLGFLSLQSYHVPGHTPGQRVFYWAEGNMLFAGDTLFRTSIGRTDFPHSGTTLEFIQAILRMVKKVPQNAWLCPGHGNPSSLLDVRRINRYIRTRLEGNQETKTEPSAMPEAIAP